MEEMIKSIMEAEQTAEQIKAEAAARAMKIIAQADAEAMKIASDCALECRMFREREIKKAEKEAEENYNETLVRKKADAKAYADTALKGTDAIVSEIVRRISRGNR